MIKRFLPLFKKLFARDALSWLSLSLIAWAFSFSVVLLGKEFSNDTFEIFYIILGYIAVIFWRPWNRITTCYSLLPVPQCFKIFFVYLVNLINVLLGVSFFFLNNVIYNWGIGRECLIGDCIKSSGNIELGIIFGAALIGFIILPIFVFFSTKSSSSRSSVESVEFWLAVLSFFTLYLLNFVIDSFFYDAFLLSIFFVSMMSWFGGEVLNRNIRKRSILIASGFVFVLLFFYARATMKSERFLLNRNLAQMIEDLDRYPFFDDEVRETYLYLLTTNITPSAIEKICEKVFYKNRKYSYSNFFEVNDCEVDPVVYFDLFMQNKRGLKSLGNAFTMFDLDKITVENMNHFHELADKISAFECRGSENCEFFDEYISYLYTRKWPYSFGQKLSKSTNPVSNLVSLMLSYEGDESEGPEHPVWNIPLSKVMTSNSKLILKKYDEVLGMWFCTKSKDLDIGNRPEIREECKNYHKLTDVVRKNKHHSFYYLDNYYVYRHRQLVSKNQVDGNTP